MQLLAIARGVALSTFSWAACVLASPSIAQVSIQQIQLDTPRSSQNFPRQSIQETDYILGGQAGNALLNPNAVAPQYPNGSLARTTQIGNNNTSSIDMSGAANIAIQNVMGNQNNVLQQQTGNRNQSSVSVYGDGNNVGTRQQDVSGASTTITVRGDNNTISAEQLRNALPISITQIGNGGNVSVSRK